VTISPNNPSGAIYPESDLREVTALCREYNLFHISDEAYEYFTFDGAHHFSPGSIQGAEEHVISLYSLSKAYGFASWRIGYMVTPPQLLESVKKIQDTNLICPPVISQYAAAGALESGRTYCEKHLAKTKEVRKLLLEKLAGWGSFATAAKTEGAFYLLLKVNSKLPALEITRRLIEEHKVAVIPGSAFGLDKACYLRIAYGVLDIPTCGEALDRLGAGLEALVG